LPEAVRRRVLALASSALPDLEDPEVPAPVRRLRSFTPSRRARLGGAQLSSALDSEGPFRAAVAGWLRAHDADLVRALDSGADPGQAGRGLAELAAAAWLLRSPSLSELAGAGGGPVDAWTRRRPVGEPTDSAAEDRLRKELRAARTQIGDLRAALEKGRSEAAEARRRDRASTERLRAAEGALGEAGAAATDEATRVAGALAGSEEEARRLRRELAAARARGESVRRGDRRDRQVADARVRVLLDSLTAAAQGLARELALPPGEGSPAALAAAGREALVQPFSGLSDRALDTADVALVDQLLRVPGVHLVVDGYNVTKTGYPTLPLEAQRQRLVAALAALAARTGAEVTCVFDGTARPAGVAAIAPRAPGTRVLFSPPGVLADEVIVDLVAAEPAGRAVLVATSDGEVVRAVRGAGARVLPSAVLLARLDR
jgi:predicted RNA-binding protein with PIN domain